MVLRSTTWRLLKGETMSKSIHHYIWLLLHAIPAHARVQLHAARLLSKNPGRELRSGLLAKLAEIRGWSAQEAEQNTEEAFFALFDRIPRP